MDDNLISYVDTIFVVGDEMIKNHGEDSYFYSLMPDFGFVGVFDGCGGIGSRKYADFNNRSGAYLASRITANAAKEWFDDFSKSNLKLAEHSDGLIKEALHLKIDTALKETESKAKSSAIKGSLSKSLPTTASIILFQKSLPGMDASFIWAGDSRGFVMDEDGLWQVTVDDIDEGTDAYVNLTGDGRLTNVITASGDYALNVRTVRLKRPSVIITSTDGCFAYFSTPMEFEYMLVDTLTHCASVKEWQTALDEYIRKYAGDDYTISLAAFGYGSFKNLKKAYSSRYKHLKSKYISRLKKCSDEERAELWNEYKNEYYRGER